MYTRLVYVAILPMVCNSSSMTRGFGWIDSGESATTIIYMHLPYITKSNYIMISFYLNPIQCSSHRKGEQNGNNVDMETL